MACALFDLNGTLLDPAGIGEPAGLDADASLGALDEAILHSMAETLSGGYRPFTDFLRSALARKAEVGGRPAGVDEAMERAAAMPPYPDAAEALDRLRTAGLRVGVLTNSATQAAEAALHAAGLALDLVVGSDQAGAYKPDPRVYRRGLERAGTEAGETWMVAAHGWDLLGAARVGMRTAWVGHKEGAVPAVVPAPHVSGASLAETAERLVAAL
jgi:2-haloacid dehalogenase